MLSCWFPAVLLSVDTFGLTTLSVYVTNVFSFTAFSVWALQSSTLGIYGCLASMCSVAESSLQNYGVINKTNTLCKDTGINHGAAQEQWEERKSIFDCLSEFQFGPVKTERVSVQDIRGVQSGAGSAGGWLSAHSSGFMCGSAEIHLPLCLHEAPEQTLPPV